MSSRVNLIVPGRCMETRAGAGPGPIRIPRAPHSRSRGRQADGPLPKEASAMIHSRSFWTFPGGIRAPAQRAARLCAVLTAPLASSHAKGRFSNFETPQTHPIEIARVNNVDYVLVCNTPDN